MNRKQRIIVSVTGIFLVLLILVGLTYAYFLTKIKGNDNERDNNTISYRLFGCRETTTLSIKDFIELINNSIAEKKKNI